MKGYVFTLAAFILLLASFYLVIIKSENVRMLEEMYGTLTKTHTLQEYVNILNEENTNDFMNASVKYALIMLAFHSAEYPLKGDPTTTNFSMVLWELVENGQVSGDYFVRGQPLALPERELSVRGMVDRINSIASKSGFVYNATLKKLEAKLISPSKLQVDYTLEISVRDISNKTGKSTSFSSQVIVDIQGLPDPIGERLLSYTGATSPYYTSINFGPKPSLRTSYGEQGNKWTYGRIGIRSNQDEPNIAIGSFNEVKDLRSNPNVNGIIIQERLNKVVACPHVDPAGNTYFNETNTFNDIRWNEIWVCEERDIDGECIRERWDCVRAPSLYPYNKPWVLIESPSLGTNDLGEQTALILTNNYYPDQKTNNPVMVVDVEGWRDFINCGKALKAPGVAPDYIQRFYERAPQLRSPYGYLIFFIEDEYGINGGFSSVGFERLDGKLGKAIRGMAGCKNPDFEKANCDLPTTVRISEDLLNNPSSPLYELRVLAE